MANLPILPNEEKIVAALEYGLVENFYELEKANETLRNLESIFISIKKTLESSYALQERDSDYLKAFNQEQELRQLEADREQQAVEPIELTRGEDAARGLGMSGFGTGFGLSLGRFLRGGALAGIAYMFAEEIAKVAETAFKTFFLSVGFKNEFTDKVSETLGKSAAGATIGAAIGSIFGKTIIGAVIGALPPITGAIGAEIGKSLGMTTGEIMGFAIFGTTVGALIGGIPGAIIGAIVGGVVGLSKKIVDDITKSKNKQGYFAGEAGVAGRGAAEGEMGAISETPALGAISKRFESGRGGVATISSGKGDPGGKSYGEFQLASKTGTLQSFLESSEGKPFAEKYNLRTADIGTEEFDKNYRIAASEDTTKFAAAQKAFITRTHYEPVKNLAQQMGFNVNDRRVQEALFSQSVQHGFAGNRKILEAAASSAKGTPEEQVRAIYKARSEYVSGQTQIPQQTREAILGRYEAEQAAVQQIVPVAAAPTPTTAAVVAGTEAARVARDTVTLQMPVTNIAPVTNTTNVANVDRKTYVNATSPRNMDPTFMRVQERNLYA